ncbi:hypothetical protein MMC30_002702 [Trapelia coarctata]|nr:hypothetical protein [Trapelia coarctata]
MADTPNRRLQQLSQQLSSPSHDTKAFENLPPIKKVAGASAGQRVKDKVIVITGANSPLGIGRATAHQFAENGARAIFLCDYSNEFLPVHKRELNSLYPSVDIHTRQFDASDEAAVKAVVGEVVEMYGRLDVMFANAAIVGAHKVFGEIEGEEFMRTMRVNVSSVFLAAKHAAPAMRLTTSSKPHPSGSIIATASVAGLRSNAGSTDYSASKAAVISLMQTIAFQLARTGIRCNAICPGLIETGMTEPTYEAARKRGTEGKIGQINPTGRGAVADEVARVALFLGSEESSYVDGQAWSVCGGLSAGHPLPLPFPSTIIPALARLRALVLSKKLLAYVTDAEKNPPYLKTWDTFGRRRDELVTSEGWRRLRGIGIAEGMVAGEYERELGEGAGGADQPAKINEHRYHIFSASSAYVICPSAMTDGAASLLQRNLSSPSLPPSTRPVLHSAFQRLVSRDPREAWMSGQWMTERSGGSDVSGTETVAVRALEGESGRGVDGAPLGPWRVSGVKWVSSATDADMCVLLARTAGGGLSAFYAPMRRMASATGDGPRSWSSIA